MAVDQAVGELEVALAGAGDPDLARGLQRYFPEPVEALGVSNAGVVALANDYFKAHALSPDERLAVAERVLERATVHEEVLLGFAVLHKVVKHSFDAGLPDRCRYWLEHYVTNWAQCDDLCLKLLYPFFLGHPALIPSTQDWLGSPSPWARRAANVSVVKFVRRKIGRETYELPLEVVFGNTRRLLDDPEPYVQKSVGWLLKVAGQIHQEEVVAFLRTEGASMNREALRIAIEKFEPALRRSLLALGSSAREGGSRR